MAEGFILQLMRCRTHSDELKTSNLRARLRSTLTVVRSTPKNTKSGYIRYTSLFLYWLHLEHPECFRKSPVCCHPLAPALRSTVKVLSAHPTLCVARRLYTIGVSATLSRVPDDLVKDSNVDREAPNSLQRCQGQARPCPIAAGADRRCTQRARNALS